MSEGADDLQQATKQKSKSRESPSGAPAAKKKMKAKTFSAEQDGFQKEPVVNVTQSGPTAPLPCFDLDGDRKKIAEAMNRRRERLQHIHTLQSCRDLSSLTASLQNG